MILQRRAFLTGLLAAGLAAPVIVRASSLMPVRPLPQGFTINWGPAVVGTRWIIVAGVDMAGNKVFKVVDMVTLDAGLVRAS